MIEHLLRFSLQRRWIVLGVAAVLSAIGIARALQMPVDVFPDLTAPRVTIVTEATGMAPEEIAIEQKIDVDCSESPIA